MKKAVLLSSFALLFASMAYSAETLNIVEGNVTYVYTDNLMGKAVFSDDGSSFTLMGRTFHTSDIERMFVDATQVENNLIAVTYNASGPAVTVAGNIASYVTIDISGSNVSITQSDAVGTETEELTYRLSGKSDDGSFNLTGLFKATIELNGLDLTSKTGAALDIQDGKRIALKVTEGTVNNLADSSTGSQKGAIVCKGHLEIKGKGELNITGNKSHAIQAKEYFEMKNASLNILGSVKDGINCTQYFLLSSGSITMVNIGDDMIQTDFKDSADREEEDTGTITVAGGSITGTVTAIAAKGLKAEGDVVVSGGIINIKTVGKGMWDSAKLKTKASSCISADGDMQISGGELTLSSTGSGGKGISVDGVLTVTGGDIRISTTGGVFAYVNGIEYDGYTGNTDRIDSDYKSSAKGIKVDTSIEINGGNFTVYTTGRGAEGIESKGELTINDGTIFVKAYDDGINSSSHMYINGGDVVSISTNNDGLDSNGNLVFSGGTVRAFGGNSPECGVDANDEEGYSVIFKGGYVLAVGGGNSTPSSTESVQPYVSGNSKPTTNTEVSLLSGDTVLATFTVPAEYGTTTTIPWNVPSATDQTAFAPGGMSGGGLLISCPGLTSGSSYTLRSGSTSSTVTATLRGSGSGRPW